MRNANLKTILGMLLLASVLFGQHLSIQGVARDNSGQSLSNGTYAFMFRLYGVETGGSEVWAENQNLEVLNGVFSVVLGDVNSLQGVDFNAQYWLSVEIDNNGELSPRTKLTVSAYAIMGDLSGQDNVVPLSGNVGIGVSAPIFKLDVAGQARLDLRDGVHNLWIQGGGGVNGTDRNLALVGFEASDQLHVNWGGEYTGGTILGGNVGLGVATPQARLDIAAGVIAMDADPANDVWIQGGHGANRNLALLGSKNDERLYVNWGSEYSNGTNIGGPVNISGHLTTNGGTQGVTTSPTGQTQIIYGWVSGSGTIESGTGFTVSRLGVGSYRISFATHFAGAPAVTFTNLGGGAGSDNTFWISLLGNTFVDVQCRESTLNANEDSRFTFIAVGPRY